MKLRKKLCTLLALLLVLCLGMTACSETQQPTDPTPAQEEITVQEPAAAQETTEPAVEEEPEAEAAPVPSALPVKALSPKQVEENPYMAKSDANIHHDGYNTDSTDEILPLGIYPEINVSYETTNANASPAIYFDSYGHAVVPLLGGIAIRDLNAEETKTLGYFSPKQHDGGGYVIQSSYTFLDAENRIVCPTSNNHVLMLRATDEAGNVLPEFEKVLDIDIKAAAEAALGKGLTQNLLSVVFDYEGNLWFATGGFRIYPEREQQGVLGYIARSAIDAILSGEQADLSDAVFVYELTPGEGAENGIAASKDGAVILTNQNCYLLRANNGVEAVWCTPYESVGAKVSGEGDKTTGGGLAWGGGCSPSLTPELVMFTDNADPVKLLALDMKTGEIVASMPVLDDLPGGYQVAVENSAIVYDDSEGTVSTIVCNWFGAGNAGLADPNSDSSIQSYRRSAVYEPPILVEEVQGGSRGKYSGFHPEGKTEEAKRLLRYSDKSLTAIGSYLGFSSASHFSRVFKTYVGSTPSEYREKHQWLVRRWVDSCRVASTRSSLRSLPQRISRDLRMLRPMRIATTR